MRRSNLAMGRDVFLRLRILRLGQKRNREQQQGGKKNSSHEFLLTFGQNRRYVGSIGAPRGNERGEKPYAERERDKPELLDEPDSSRHGSLLRCLERHTE